MKRSWLAALALVVMTGCASSTRIQVDSITCTNRGEPIYMMVRNGDDLVEPYESAAKRMFNKEVDPAVLQRQVIIPGTTFSVTLPTPEDGDLGIYFFFTNYDKSTHQFRLVVSHTQLPAEIQVLLGINGIADHEIRER